MGELTKALKRIGVDMRVTALVSAGLQFVIINVIIQVLSEFSLISCPLSNFLL